MKIAIAGSGLVGRILALELLQKGHEIVFFEKESKQGTTCAGFTAAGMLAPFAELETAESIIFEYGKRSMALWGDLLERVGMRDSLQLEGSLITAHPQDRNELEHFIQTLRFKVPEAKEITPLDSDQIATLEPQLSIHARGFFLAQEGQVDAQRFILQSTRFLDSHERVEWHEFTPVQKLEEGCVVLADGTKSSFDWVFDARGLGAQEYFSDLRGVRGEVFWIETDEVEITRPTRLMHPRYKIYVVPRPKGGYEGDKAKERSIKAKRYIVGATEIESEDASPVSVRSSLEMLSAVFSLHPAFGEARVVNTETNCRPAFRDNLPRIEQNRKLTRINGLYRHGYLLAPAIVEKALNEGVYAA